jgi:hypothetical protein
VASGDILKQAPTIDFKQANPVDKENYGYLAHISKYYELPGGREGVDGQRTTKYNATR